MRSDDASVRVCVDTVRRQRSDHRKWPLVGSLYRCKFSKMVTDRQKSFKTKKFQANVSLAKIYFVTRCFQNGGKNKISWILSFDYCLGHFCRNRCTPSTLRQCCDEFFKYLVFFSRAWSYIQNCKTCRVTNQNGVSFSSSPYPYLANESHKTWKTIKCEQ